MAFYYLRKVRSISLTPEGVKLAQVSHQSLQQLSTTLEELSSSHPLLRVGTTASFASMWLVPTLTRFQIIYPEIQVEIKTGEELLDIKRDRRIDIAIRYGYFDDKDKDAIKLVTDSFTAYGTQGYIDRHPSLEDGSLIETEWKNKELPPIAWAQWLQQFYSQNTVPKVRVFDQEQHVMQAALAGQGLALLSSLLVKMASDQGWLKLFQAGSSLPSLTYYLLTSPFSKDLRKVIVFKQWLIEKLSKKA